MAEEIRQKITIEGAEEIISKLESVSKAEKDVAKSTEAVGDEATKASTKVDRQKAAVEKMREEASQAARALREQSGETKEAGNAADQASGQMDRASKSQDGLGASVAGSIRSWLSWTAVVAAATVVVRDVVKTAIEGANAVQALGQQLNNLAVNQGGKVADQTIRDINAIARTERLSVDGRNELINAASTITDLTPDISQDDLQAQLGRVARLRRVAGDAAGKGDQTAALLQTAQARAGLTPDAAADQVAALLTSGFDQQTLGDLYRKGDSSLIAAVYGARAQGLDLRRSASTIPRIVGALDRRDAEGNITEDLAAAGITDGMSTIDRMRAIGNAAQDGRITPSQQIALLGGQEAAEVSLPLLRASTPDAIAQAQAEINATTIASLQARRAQSTYVQAADAGAARELSDRLALEQSRLSGAGAAMQEFGSDLVRRGGGSPWLGAIDRGNMITNWGEMSQQMMYGPERQRPQIINIGQAYYLNNEGESRLTRPSGDKVN